MSLIANMLDKIISIFLGNSGVIFNICVIGILALLTYDQIEENAKKKHRAR